MKGLKTSSRKSYCGRTKSSLQESERRFVEIIILRRIIIYFGHALCADRWISHRWSEFFMGNLDPRDISALQRLLSLPKRGRTSGLNKGTFVRIS